MNLVASSLKVLDELQRPGEWMQRGGPHELPHALGEGLGDAEGVLVIPVGDGGVADQDAELVLDPHPKGFV